MFGQFGSTVVGKGYLWILAKVCCHFAIFGIQELNHQIEPINLFMVFIFDLKIKWISRLSLCLGESTFLLRVNRISVNFITFFVLQALV